MPQSSEMGLGEKQELFAQLEAQWVLWVLSHQGWKLRHGEGRILQQGPDGRGRRVVDNKTGLTMWAKDRVHMDGGTHYMGLGADWNLFVDGVFIQNSSHPAWVASGEHWESLHPLCRWGGRFHIQDGNHISLEHGGVA